MKIKENLVINDNNVDLYKNYYKETSSYINSPIFSNKLNSIRNTYSLITFCLGVICSSALNPLVPIISPIYTFAYCSTLAFATGIIIKKVYKYVMKKRQENLFIAITKYGEQTMQNDDLFEDFNEEFLFNKKDLSQLEEDILNNISIPEGYEGYNEIKSLRLVYKKK